MPLRRVHNFSEGDVLLEATLATLIFKCKSSAPNPVFILLLKLIYHLHVTTPGRTVWRYSRGGQLWDRRIITSILWPILSARVGKWALVTTIDTHGAGARVNKNFSEFGWLRGNSRISLLKQIMINKLFLMKKKGSPAHYETSTQILSTIPREHDCQRH